jgi:hypothetical protein
MMTYAQCGIALNVMEDGGLPQYSNPQLEQNNPRESGYCDHDDDVDDSASTYPKSFRIVASFHFP